MRAFLFSTVLAAAVSTTAVAAERYVIDANHTDVVWSASHFGFSDSHGKFADLSGVIELDKDAPANSKVNVTINTASVVTGIEKFDAHLRSPDFFASEEFPEATFVSESVEITGDDTADITGTLTLRGVSKPVTLAATLNKMGENPYNKKQTVGFNAETTINRSDFGITYALPGIPEQVGIHIAAEAVLEETKENAGVRALQFADAETVMNDASEQAEDAAENTADAAEEAYENATGAAADMAESAGDAAEDAADTAESAYDAAADTAEESYESATGAAEQPAEETAEAVDEATENGVEAAENAAEETEEAVESAADATAETAEDAVEAADNAAEEAGEAASDTAEAAGEKADTFADNAENIAEETMTESAEAAESFADKASAMAKSAYDAVVDAWNELTGDAEGEGAQEEQAN